LTSETTSDRVNSDLLEFNTHSFIVKIWLEETADEGGKPSWRGHITHVPSGKRSYLKSLSGMIAFVLPYLRSMGVRFGFIRQIRDWLGTWRHISDGRG
jgi:hypothetical protein